MTTITIDRATVEQALEALERARPLKADYTTLEYFEEAKRKHYAAMAAFRTALAQQAEPVEPGAWVASKDGRVIYDDASTDDGLLRVSGDFENDEQRIRYAQRIVDKLNAAPPKAEPLNLRDPAVQKRLATQWGYVHEAQQAEPVAQFDPNTMPGQADAHLRALLRYTENFYATAIEHGMRAGPTANAIAHVERAGKALHQIVHAQAKMLEPARPAQPVEPVEPVAWIESPHGAIRANPNYKFTFPSQLLHWQIPLYTAPPQRKLVPLTEEEIDAEWHELDGEASALFKRVIRKFARAVERAHGIKE